MRVKSSSLIARSISLYIILSHFGSVQALTLRINDQSHQTESKSPFDTQPNENFKPKQTEVGVQPEGGNGEKSLSETTEAGQKQQLSLFIELHRISISESNNVTCNDGSPIGYYKRLNKHSKSWVIFLEGGGYCSSADSCKRRWQQSPNLMSSKFWPQTMTVDGILSSEAKQNPYLWNANHVFVPYCSSDSWSGSRDVRMQTGGNGNGNGSQEFAFMGSKIIEQVILSLYDELPPETSLFGAKFILLAGDSAGATGVVLNLDKVSDLISDKLATSRLNCGTNSNQKRETDQEKDARSHCDTQPEAAPVLRGLADSGWFVDNEPYQLERASEVQVSTTSASLFVDQLRAVFTAAGASHQTDLDCERQVCRPVEAIRQAMHYWRGQVPPSCSQRYPKEPWLCYFAYRTYQTLRTPLFVVQWLYDEVQLMADNVYLRPESQAEWAYVRRVAQEMRASLENVTAIFAPSCFSHGMITKKSWNQISINGLKLPHILNFWEEQSLGGYSNGISIQSDQQVRSSDPDQSSTSEVPASFSSLTDQIVTSHPSTAPQDQRSRHEMISRPLRSTGLSSSLRSRSRKRKRNHQQQQQQTLRSKHQRQKAQTGELSPSYPGQSFHHLIPLTSSKLDPSESANGRQGRSAAVEDATILLSNNVPGDDSLGLPEPRMDANGRWIVASPFEQIFQPISGHFGTRSASDSTISQQESFERYQFNRFRLIDSCSWPQCNRECPVVESDVLMGGLTIF